MLPIANERGNFPDDLRKKDPLDFVLWQAQSTGEPAWESPWGFGRPGWHIECSVMSAKYLGQPVDIHGGGADLVFPHHECEIAQAECGTGEQPFTRVWMHVGMLRYQGEKMSKSLGNLVMVRDLLEGGWEPDAIRLCIASHHYREEWDYDTSNLESAARLVEKFKSAVSSQSGTVDAFDVDAAKDKFLAAMDDDLDTPLAISALNQLAETILAGNGATDTQEAQQILKDFCGILGLRLDSGGPERAVYAGWEKHKKRFVG